MTLKDYLNKTTIYNHSAICKIIEWDQASFSKWLSGKRGIPKGKEEALTELFNNESQLINKWVKR